MKKTDKKADKKKIMDSFKDKKFKYGGYATLLTAFVLAILVVVNLVVGQIPYKIDLTENRMFSLSDQTEKLLENLDQEIRIIGLYKAGQENPTFDEILQRYRRINKNISITYIDPVKNPTFANQYTKDGTDLREGSYIVESNDKYKVIDYYDLFNISSDQYGNSYPESLAVEQRVTSAIQYVIADELPTIYTLEGHLEQTLPFQLQQQMELENYEIKPLSLLTEESVPSDATILMVIAPQRDITSEEEEKIREFLNNNGRAMFFMDVVEEEMPNFDSLFKSYGVALNKSLIIEGDRNHYFQSPAWIVPKLETHDIISPMRTNKMQVLTIGAQGIEELDIKKRSIEIKPLLVTSDDAWGKKDLSSEILEKEEGDPQGPFNVAVAIEDNEWNEEENAYDETKLVVVGDAEFLNPQFASIGNADFVLNGLNWLQDEQESISIRPKSLTSSYLTINAFQKLVIAGITVILIPLIILGAGLVMWLRRRHL